MKNSLIIAVEKAADRQLDRKEDTIYENDISAQEEAACEGSRIQVQNEHPRRKKGSRSQKGKGQKEIDRLTFNQESRRNVAFCYYVQGNSGINNL